MKKRNIVIVGGGYAGVETFLNLDKKIFRDPSIQIILLSKSNFFYHNVASPRTLVEETLIPRICIPYDKIFTKSNTKFIHGKLVSVKSNEIKYIALEGSDELAEETLSFEYLVLALGSTYVHPFHANSNNRAEQINYSQTSFNQMKDANRLLVIGGGAVGVELAGEIATDYPNKQITLVSSNDRLLTTMSPKASKLALEILENLKVQVIFNERIDYKSFNENFKTNKVTLSNGKEIEFDAYFQCVGVKPNTQIIKESQPTWVNDKGFIKVNANLQVSMGDGSNVFALGDCCDTDEEKMALKCADHAKVVANNIDYLVKNQTNKVQEYKLSSFKLMLVTIGRENAIFQAGPLTISGFLPVMIKGKGLFVEKYRNILGYYKYQRLAEFLFGIYGLIRAVFFNIVYNLIAP